MQAKAVGVTIVWTAVVAWIAYLIANMIVGLRVTEEEEREGLDVQLPRRDRLPHVIALAGDDGRLRAPVFLCNGVACRDCRRFMTLPRRD